MSLFSLLFRCIVLLGIVASTMCFFWPLLYWSHLKENEMQYKVRYIEMHTHTQRMTNRQTERQTDGWTDGRTADSNGSLFRKRRIYSARSRSERFDHFSKKSIKNTRCKNYGCIKISQKTSVFGQHFELLLHGG